MNIRYCYVFMLTLCSLVFAHRVPFVDVENGRAELISIHEMRFCYISFVTVDGQKYLEGTPEEVRRDERLQKIYFGD